MSCQLSNGNYASSAPAPHATTSHANSWMQITCQRLVACGPSTTWRTESGMFGPAGRPHCRADWGWFTGGLADPKWGASCVPQKKAFRPTSHQFAAEWDRGDVGFLWPVLLQRRPDRRPSVQRASSEPPWGSASSRPLPRRLGRTPPLGPGYGFHDPRLICPSKRPAQRAAQLATSSDPSGVWRTT